MQEVELTIPDRLHVARQRFPVTVGVPFPAGQVDDASQLSLVDEQGNQLPLQARAAATRRWDDGTLRWVFLDFQVDMQPKQTRRLRLRYGRDVRPHQFAPELTVRESDDSIEVHTGPLRFTVSKRGFNLFDQVWLDGEKVLSGSGLSVVDGEGRIFEAKADLTPEVVVEEAGPLRCVIKGSGTFTNDAGDPFLDFAVRIHAFAGQPYVKVLHSFYNMARSRIETRRVYSGTWFREQGVPFSNVAEVSLALDPVLSGKPRTVMAGWLPIVYEASGEISLYQTVGSIFDADHTLRAKGAVEAKCVTPEGAVPFDASLDATMPTMFRSWQPRTEPDGTTLVEMAASSDGWLDVSDDSRGMGLRLREFWRNAPKKLTWEEGKLLVQLWPKDAGMLQLTEGAGKTHEIWLDFHKGDCWLADEPRRLEAFIEPLMAILPPESYQQSGTVGLIFPPAERRRPLLELRIARSFGLHIAEQDVFDNYFAPAPGIGMMNYGDEEYAEGSRNNEYDLAHHWLLQFLRTGRRAYFQNAEARCLHTIDVDYCRHSSDPLTFEGLHIHSKDHNTAPPRASHQWVESLLEFYHLTGNPEALEAAKGIGRNCARQVESGDNLFVIAREPGWCLRVLAQMFEETHEEVYRQAGEKLLNAIAAWQGEDGGFEVALKFYYRYFPFGDTFCTGILLSAVYLWWKATGSHLAKEIFRKGCEWQLTFRNRDGYLPGMNPGYSLFLDFEPFAYAVEMLGKDKYMRIAMKTWSYFQEIGGGRYPMAEPISADFRAMIPFLHVADQLGLLDEFFGPDVAS